jgi:hypothetical protein
LGKKERQVCADEGYTGLQENHWSEADECSHAEEVVGNDESKVGGEKEGGVDSVDLLSPWCLRRGEATAEKVEVTAR